MEKCWIWLLCHALCDWWYYTFLPNMSTAVLEFIKAVSRAQYRSDSICHRFLWKKKKRLELRVLPPGSSSSLRVPLITHIKRNTHSSTSFARRFFFLLSTKKKNCESRNHHHKLNNHCHPTHSNAINFMIFRRRRRKGRRENANDRMRHTILRASQANGK